MTRKWLALSVLFFFLIISSVFLKSNFINAEEPTPTPTVNQAPSSAEEALNRKKQEIKDLENKLNDLRTQSKTLASQIAIMSSQIKLTQLRINAVEQEIEALISDIDITIRKISSLEESLDKLTKVLINRIVATYQVGSIQPLAILLSSGTVSDFFTRANYLRIAQAHDKKLIFETQQAKNDYSTQKEIFQSKKEKVEVLKSQLEAYTAQLDQEKKNRENLLAVTKNSEQEYQRRLADALKELQQIQQAARVLITTTPRQVARGEPIGLMGNTGYSFGAHLHFGVYNISSLEQYDYYSNSENPANALESNNVDWETECSGDPRGQKSTGTGSLAWPMSTGDLHITQGYGRTCYSDVYYRGNPHPAFDMYNNSNVVVKSAEEGQAYFCRNCTGDGGNGVFIFHPNGKMSLYWHLQ